MPRPAETPCATVRDRLEALLDGDLARAEESRFRDHLDGCPACREELRLAGELRRALRHGLPTLECPPEVTARVLAAAERDVAATNGHRAPGPAGAGQPRRAPAEGPRDRISAWISTWVGGERGAGRLRPAASLAAVAALLVLLAVVPVVLRQALTPGGAPGPEPGPELGQTAGRATPAGDYSAQEIAEAEEQARLVLAAVAQVGRGAGRTVRDEIFEGALARPALQVMESLQGGSGGAERGVEPRRPDEERRRP